MEEQTQKPMADKIKTLQRIIDEQMENLIQKELLLLKYKEDSQKESRNVSTQTLSEKSDENFLAEIMILNQENIKLRKEIKALKLNQSENKNLQLNSENIKEKNDKLKKENEALMEMLNKQNYSSTKALNVK